MKSLMEKCRVTNEAPKIFNTASRIADIGAAPAGLIKLRSDDCDKPTINTAIVQAPSQNRLQTISNNERASWHIPASPNGGASGESSCLQIINSEFFLWKKVLIIIIILTIGFGCNLATAQPIEQPDEILKEKMRGNIANAERKLDAAGKQKTINYFDLATLNNEIGGSYYILQNYSEAEIFIKKSLGMILEIPFKAIPTSPPSDQFEAAAHRDIVARIVLEGTISHNLGSVYFKQKKFQQAKTCFERSVATAKMYPIGNRVIKYLEDLEKVYIELNDLESAKEVRREIFDEKSKPK